MHSPSNLAALGTFAVAIASSTALGITTADPSDDGTVVASMTVPVIVPASYVTSSSHLDRFDAQEEVVRTSDSTLNFYYRVTPTASYDQRWFADVQIFNYPGAISGTPFHFPAGDGEEAPTTSSFFAPGDPGSPKTASLSSLSLGKSQRP